MALRASRGSIGERLRQAREDRGIDLDRAAEDTRIDRGHLEALESDAPLDEHHAGLYARIFLREYARYLGLDPKPLVGAYQASHTEPVRPLIGGPAPVDRRPGRWIAPVLIILSVGVIAALAVVRGLQQSPDVPVPPETMVPAPASPTSGPAEEDREAPPPPPPDRLVLRIVDAESWVQVSREGEVLLNDTFPAGYSRGFRIGDGLDLVLGNAGAVRLTAGGEPLGELGGSGEVYSGSVVVQDAEARLLP
jgi:cytoskeleton protein RodZ